MILSKKLILKMAGAEEVEVIDDKIIISYYDIRTDELIKHTYNNEGDLL